MKKCELIQLNPVLYVTKTDNTILINLKTVA